MDFIHKKDTRRETMYVRVPPHLPRILIGKSTIDEYEESVEDGPGPY